MKKIILITGPSGVGKTMGIKHILDTFTNQITALLQVTTRDMRPDDIKSLIKCVSPKEFTRLKNMLLVYHGKYGLLDNTGYSENNCVIGIVGYKELMKIKRRNRKYKIVGILINYKHFNKTELNRRLKGRADNISNFKRTYDYNSRVIKTIFSNPMFQQKYVDYQLLSDNSMIENLNIIINNILGKSV